jgi:ferrous iron transport protein A
MTPLGLVNEGERVEIVGTVGRRGQEKGCRDGHGRLAQMGLHPGVRIEMIQNRGQGPLLLRLEESYIALGRGLAMKIFCQEE